jgi:hypothetical protein
MIRCVEIFQQGFELGIPLDDMANMTVRQLYLIIGKPENTVREALGMGQRTTNFNEAMRTWKQWDEKRKAGLLDNV